MNGDMFPEAVVPKIDENRRYTTRSFMNFIKRVAGVTEWDLDPDADAESHHAPRWFSLLNDPGSSGQDSLAQSWLPPPEWLTDEAFEARRRNCSPRGNAWEQIHTWRIFDNPPFDAIGPRLEKVWALLDERLTMRDEEFDLRIAMVMPGNRTEQGFWQDHVEPFLEGHENAGRLGYELVAHSPRTRQFYGHPGNPEPKSGQAEWPSVVLVWRRAW